MIDIVVISCIKCFIIFELGTKGHDGGINVGFPTRWNKFDLFPRSGKTKCDVELRLVT